MSKEPRNPKCPECGAPGRKVTKYGFAKMVIGRKPQRIQRFRCNECFRCFVIPKAQRDRRSKRG